MWITKNERRLLIIYYLSIRDSAKEYGGPTDYRNFELEKIIDAFRCSRPQKGAMLLKDSSLPCNCLAVATHASSGCRST